jgi:hypothetical protein
MSELVFIGTSDAFGDCRHPQAAQLRLAASVS